MNLSTPHRRPPRALALVTLLALVSGAAACRGDGKTPVLYTAAEEPPPPATEEGTPPADAEPIPEPHRDLWFARGPGREAILERERHDYAAATERLDALLGDPALAADDRGAALLLRGLEDVRAGDHARAAERFAEARKSPGLRDIDARLRLLEGQALLDSGQAAAALAVLEGGPLDGALTGAGLIADADARQRTGDREGALELYERFLRDYGDAPRRHEARIKLARILAQSEDPAELQRAHDLYERLLLDVPLSDYGQEASAKIPELLARIGGPRSLSSELDKARARTLARLQELLSRGRYKTLLAEVDAFLRIRKLPRDERCEALYIRASAVFKQRKRAEARPKFEQAAAECKKAGITDTEVRARYQAGRGRYAEGHYERAAKDFEALARDYPDHSYADDAWVLAGESWAEIERRPEERAAYEKAAALGGDMAAEARRRLVIRAFVDQRFDDALKLLDDGLAAGEKDPVELAKLRYYRGRALARLGRQDEAEAAWVDALREAPLSYPAILALSRLRDAGDAALARGIAVLEEERPPPRRSPPASSRSRMSQRPGAPASSRASASARRRATSSTRPRSRAGPPPPRSRRPASTGSRSGSSPPSAAAGGGRRRWVTSAGSGSSLIRSPSKR
ncbi:MAG: tetratricopeptide repeat protein [Myxococcales bacterium]|nr:tetratricopeptide repeat protein [Myxococcales bacterium]